jgi:hypothetical protein
MAYTIVNWKARKGTNLNKFTKSAETSTSVILTNAPDAVTDSGTPVSVENLNIMDAGIANLDTTKAPLVSPALTGVPKVPSKSTAASSDGTLIATEAQVALKANIASPAFTGTPTAPTAAVGTTSTQIATTAYVKNVLDDQRIIGEIIELPYEPSGADQLKYKIIEADGSTISDSKYATLRAKTGWTKLPDYCGITLRGRGLSKSYTMANATPYDGGSIGEHIPDAIQNITGLINSVVMADYTAQGVFATSLKENAAVPAGGQSYNKCSLQFDASRAVRTAAETRVASVAVWYGISY